MHWSDRYIGLPYSDHNCAEFVAKVATEQYGLDVVLPNEMPDMLKGQQREINNRFYNYVHAEKLDAPQDGCVVLMHAKKRMCHIGLAV